MLFVNISFWIILLYFATSSLPGWATKTGCRLVSENLSIDMSEAGPLVHLHDRDLFLHRSDCGRYLVRQMDSAECTGTHLYRFHRACLDHSGTPAVRIRRQFRMIVGGGLCFGIGFGIFDANNMPILCQFVSPRYRATAYGIMNMTGVFAGAIITKLLGESTDAGNLGHDFAMMASLVFVALVVEVIFLRPRTVNMTDK